MLFLFPNQKRFSTKLLYFLEQHFGWLKYLPDIVSQGWQSICVLRASPVLADSRSFWWPSSQSQPFVTNLWYCELFEEAECAGDLDKPLQHSNYLYLILILLWRWLIRYSWCLLMLMCLLEFDWHWHWESLIYQNLGNWFISMLKLFQGSPACPNPVSLHIIIISLVKTRQSREKVAFPLATSAAICF